MLAGETYAFSQGYDYGYSFKHVMNQMGKNIPLFIFTDSKSILYTTTKSKRLRERRLMNNTADIRRAYRDDEISNIGWTRSKNNIVDNLKR